MAGKNGVSLTLPGKITIEKAAALKASLQKIKGKYQGLFLDFRKVEEIDLAGVQVITSFLLDCSAGNLDIRCTGPLNPGISRILEISGLLASGSDGDYLFPFLNDKGVKLELS